MLTVRMIPGEQLAIRAHYLYSQRIRKAVPVAKFQYMSKEWVIPIAWLGNLENEFPDQIYYKTPKYEIFGEEPPDYRDTFRVDESIEVPKLSLKPYGYQDYGIRFMAESVKKNGFVLNSDVPGLGKCHGKGTKILMHDGTRKNAEDIVAGDLIMGDDGSPREVLSTAKGKERMYEVTLENGDSFTCNESHVLSMYDEDGKYMEMTMREYLALGWGKKQCLRAWKGSFPDSFGIPLPKEQDAYLLGRVIPLEYGIPTQILVSTKQERLSFLAGMADTYAHRSGQWLLFPVIGKEDAEGDLRFLVQGLGIRMERREAYIAVFRSNMIPSKIHGEGMKDSGSSLYKFFVEPEGIGEYYGFCIGGNHLYMLGDFTVTHNTVQAIGTVQHFMEKDGVKKIMIVCKKSIRQQWLDEIRRFAHWEDDGFLLLRTGDTKKKRLEAYKKARSADSWVLVTNYHSFLNDEYELSMLGADFFVIDEVHSVKAREGKMNQAIMRTVSGKPVIFLTGTPIMARPEDLFGIVQIAGRDYLGEYGWFERRYLEVDWSQGYKEIIGAKRISELRKKAQKITIRRTEREVSIDLPDVINIPVKCTPDSVQKTMMKLAEEEAASLEASKSQIMADIREGGRMEPSPDEALIMEKADALLKGLISVRQAISSDPALIPMAGSKRILENYGSLLPSSYRHSAKTEQMLGIVEDIIESGEKVLIFSKFRTSAYMIKEEIESTLKVPALLYTGAENDEERIGNVDNFTKGDGYPILIGTEAMAEGLNLQVAKYVINYDQPDTFAIKEQRMGRVRRASSSHSAVIVYDMITESEKDFKSSDEEHLAHIKKTSELSDAIIALSDAEGEALAMAQGA